MKQRLSVVVLSMLVAVAVAPGSALADKLRFQASFAVGLSVTPNSPPVSYCGGPAQDLKVEGHGSGFSSLGALAFSLNKTISAGVMHGCLTLNTPNGDNLFATYDAVEGEGNANNFNTTKSGRLIFTGGTGLFKGAKGMATFTAVFDGLYPASSFFSGTGAAPFQVMGFYVIDGSLFAGRSD